MKVCLLNSSLLFLLILLDFLIFFELKLKDFLIYFLINIFLVFLLGIYIKAQEKKNEQKRKRIAQALVFLSMTIVLVPISGQVCQSWDINTLNDGINKVCISTMAYVFGMIIPYLYTKFMKINFDKYFFPILPTYFFIFLFLSDFSYFTNYPLLGFYCLFGSFVGSELINKINNKSKN